MDDPYLDLSARLRDMTDRAHAAEAEVVLLRAECDRLRAALERVAYENSPAGLEQWEVLGIFRDIARAALAAHKKPATADSVPAKASEPTSEGLFNVGDRVRIVAPDAFYAERDGWVVHRLPSQGGKLYILRHEQHGDIAYLAGDFVRAADQPGGAQS
jgi:hypothetical protein